jgi:hypothetical protein
MADMHRLLVALVAAASIFAIAAPAGAAPHPLPPADPIDPHVHRAVLAPADGTTLGPWHLTGHYAALAATANEGVATSGDSTLYRGVATVPLDLRLKNWNHVGDLDVHEGYVLDDYQGPDGATSKLYSVTAPNGIRSDYPHPLAPGELMNNSFATISPDGQWFVSGEWLQVQRLLVFAMPQLNPAAPAAGQPLPLAATIQLDRPVRDVQGCDFATATRLLCAADDAGTDLWPTPKQLLQVDLARPLDGTTVTAHVTSLGELPLQSLCSGTFEVEGIDVDGSQLLVEVTPPSPCNYAVTTVYRYTQAG